MTKFIPHFLITLFKKENLFHLYIYGLANFSLTTSSTTEIYNLQNEHHQLPNFVIIHYYMKL